MKQSYDKDQRATAKKKKLPMIVIGWNGEYQPDKSKQTEALCWGPVSPKAFELIRRTFVKIAEMK